VCMKILSMIENQLKWQADFFSARSSSRCAASHRARDQREHKEDEEDEEENLGDRGRTGSNASETENCGDDRDDEKGNGPAEHWIVLQRRQRSQVFKTGMSSKNSYLIVLHITRCAGHRFPDILNIPASAFDGAARTEHYGSYTENG